MPPSGTRLHDRLLRRWYLTLLGVLATIGLCVLALLLVPIKYQAQANILLTPPFNALSAKNINAGTTNTNPYFSLAGLQPLADVVGRSMTTGSTVAQLKHRGLTGTYTVLRDQTTDGPILIVTVNGSTAPRALANLRLVLGTATPALDALQAKNSVPLQDQITIQVISFPTKASTVIKSRLRALVVAGAAGLIGTALVVSGIDELLLRRRRRGAGAKGDEADDRAAGAEQDRPTDAGQQTVVVWPDIPPTAVRSDPELHSPDGTEPDSADTQLFVTKHPVGRANGEEVVRRRDAHAPSATKNIVGEDNRDEVIFGHAGGAADPPSTLFVVRDQTDRTSTRLQ